MLDGINNFRKYSSAPHSFVLYLTPRRVIDPLEKLSKATSVVYLLFVESFNSFVKFAEGRFPSRSSATRQDISSESMVRTKRKKKRGRERERERVRGSNRPI